MARGKKTIVHVNQHVIRANRKHGTNEPPITVRDYQQVQRCHKARIDGPCEIVHSPEKPLSCGARVWIETKSEVVIEA